MSEKNKYLDDYLNPVLVKETRQFFHNKLFLSLVGGLLGVQLLILFIFTLSYSEWKDSSAAGIGFIVIDTILMYLCVCVTAVWNPMQNFTEERSSKELDFSNITLLSPWQIIGGKLASSLVIWGLTAALCLPFMTVAYFFRNVSLERIFLIFGAGVMPTLVLIQGALFCGTIGKKWVYAVFAYFALQVVAPGVIAGLIPLLENKRFGTSLFWVIQGGWLTLFAFLLAATIAMVTPACANKMLPLRLLLTGLASIVLGALFFVRQLHEIPSGMLSFLAAGVISFFFLLAVCDRDEPGGRVLAAVPRNRVGKFFHYLFSSNRRGGMVLALLALLIFGAETLILYADGKTGILPIAFGLAGYAAVYAELSIWLNRRIPALPGWAALPVIVFILGVLPVTAAANSQVETADIVTSPISLLSSDALTIFDISVWIAPLTAFLFGLLFFIDMLFNYKHYKAPEQPSAIQEQKEEK